MRNCPAQFVLMAMLVSGCARTQSFRAIDAQTGAPLGGVTIAQSGSASKPGSESRTEASGMAEFRGTGGRFTFRKEGYFESAVEAGKSSAKVIYGEDRRQQQVERFAGIVQVPLVRNPVDPGMNPADSAMRISQDSGPPLR
jgi:hypothetical protein